MTSTLHACHRRRMVAAAATLLFLFLLPAAPAVAQPSNDAFADATPITELPFSDSVDLTGATTEPGERTSHCAPVAGTVWYAVHMEEYGIVKVDTAGSNTDTVLGVFEGESLAHLTLIHCNDDNGDSPQASLSLEAFPGITVYVQAGVFGDAVPEGSRLEISFSEEVVEPPPPVKGNRPFRYRLGEQVDLASAEWVSITDTTSVITSVVGLDGMWHSMWGQDHRVRGKGLVFFHTHKELNERTGETVRTEYEAFAGLPRTAFVFDPSMRGATLGADAVAYAYRCVTPPGGTEDDTTCTELGYFPVRLDIGWQGHGETWRGRVFDKYIVPDFKVWFSGRVTFREANAEGTIMVEGLDRPLADGPADTFEYLVRTAESITYIWRD